ncbi:MAG: DUF616 domain-containing protein, partial [Comamonadaceae bacterium]
HCTFMTPDGLAPNPRLCVYTLLIGGYERLNEQAVARTSNVPFICLTDDPTLKSETWRVVQVAPAFPMDPIRSQRVLKICPHRIPALSGFDRSLYIDNSVVLRKSPEALLADLPMASGLGLPGHSFRRSVHDEFLEVARLGLDDQARIFEQLNHYLASGDTALDEKPHWTAILLRDHRNAQVREAMSLWASHVLRYSRRDQLSFNTAMNQARLVPDRWEIDNYASSFHSWPHIPGRARFTGGRDPRATHLPLPTQLLQARAEFAAARQELVDANEALAAARLDFDSARREAGALQEQLTACASLLASAQAQAAAQSARAEAARLELDAMAPRLAHIEQEHRAAMDAVRAAVSEDTVRQTLAAVHASTSWRVTAPLRRIKRWLSWPS